MRAILMVLLFAPFMVFAQEVTLKKITADHSKFSATGAGIQVGQTYNLNSDSSVCTAQVIKSNGRSGILKVTSCDDRDSLKAGDLFMLVGGGGDLDSPESLTPKRSAGASGKFGHRVGAGLLYSTADKMTYSRAIGGQTGGAEEASSAAFGVDGTYHWFRPMNVGVSARLSYEMNRELKSITVNGNTQPYNNKPGLAITTLEVSANFILDMGAYAYAGINYPYMMLASDYNKMSGSMGYQAGGGYLVTKEIGVDLQMRFLRGSGTFKNGVVSGEMKDIKIDGFLLTGTYYFFDF